MPITGAAECSSTDTMKYHKTYQYHQHGEMGMPNWKELNSIDVVSMIVLMLLWGFRMLEPVVMPTLLELRWKILLFINVGDSVRSLNKLKMFHLIIMFSSMLGNFWSMSKKLSASITSPTTYLSVLEREIKLTIWLTLWWLMTLLPINNILLSTLQETIKLMLASILLKALKVKVLSSLQLLAIYWTVIHSLAILRVHAKLHSCMKSRMENYV